MIEIANDHSLIQHVREPTHGNNILDLLFSTNPDPVQSVTVAPGMSYHDIVLADINTKLKGNKKKPRMVYLFTKGDTNRIKADLFGNLIPIARSKNNHCRAGLKHV